MQLFLKIVTGMANSEDLQEQSGLIATDKRGYPHNIFLISPQKHMLWVLIRSTSPKRF